MIQNIEYCKYTYRHRKALLYYIKSNKFLSKEDKKEMMKRARYHDLDKMTMYLFWSKKSASDFHRHMNKHHLSEYGGNKSDIGYYDKMEAVFDFECAALTKWDKPLNAFDTMKKWYPELEDELLPILQKLHMDSSYIAVTNSAQKYMKQYEIVTEKMILDEVRMYLSETDENIYTILKSGLCSEEEYEKLMKEEKITTWEELKAKYPHGRPSAIKEYEKDYVENCFNLYEQEGFAKKFWSQEYTDKIGKNFKVLSRCTEKTAYLEYLPMWRIKLSDGTVLSACPEEIIPSEMRKKGCDLEDI